MTNLREAAVGLAIVVPLLGGVTSAIGAGIVVKLGVRWLWVAAAAACVLIPVASWRELSSEWDAGAHLSLVASVLTMAVGLCIAPAFGMWRLRQRVPAAGFWRSFGAGAIGIC